MAIVENSKGEGRASKRGTVASAPLALMTGINPRSRLLLTLSACMACVLPAGFLAAAAQRSYSAGRVSIAKTWDDAAINTLEVPLADPRGSPKHISADYYYRIPVRPVYKQYPVFAPGYEPPGYLDWLRRQPPEVVWDARGRAPRLVTEEDWIRAGEIAFDAPIIYDQAGTFTLEDVRSRSWYIKGDVPVAADGRLPFLHYVIRQKGKLELGGFSCAMCHTRVLPDGTVVKGAQGNFSLERAASHSSRRGPPPYLLQGFIRSLWAVPWLNPDPLDTLAHLPIEQLSALGETIPPGVNSRHRTNPLSPPHVPDLIGVQHRRYLDATGLQQHRSLVDMMRYAALNQGADALASFNGFIPADIPNFKRLPIPPIQ